MMGMTLPVCARYEVQNKRETYQQFTYLQIFIALVILDITGKGTNRAHWAEYEKY